MKINHKPQMNGVVYAMMLAAAFLGLAGSASAQNCTQVQSVDPIVTAESFSELAGDIIITCTGGSPTPGGQPVPAVTITLFTNVTITSKITDGGANSPAFNEALLMVDDPNTPFNNGPLATGGTTYTHPVLACGSANAPFDNGNPGVCSVMATGNPATMYDGNGTVGAARPNVFQGRQVTGNAQAIQFINVPLDPPGYGLIHTYRITNVRINAYQASGGAPNLLNSFPSLIQMVGLVTFSPISSIVASNSPVAFATIRSGLGTLAGSTGVTGVTSGPYPQCSSSPGVSGGSLTVSEGYSTSFKARNWALTQANGSYNDAADWIYGAGASPIINPPDINQNVPGALYSTASGFTFAGPTSTSDPTPNPPPGINQYGGGTATSLSQDFAQTGLDTGLVSAGQASNGTRLAFSFSNIPTGSGATVPTVIPLMNGTQSGSQQSGVMVYVAGADASGAGGAPSVIGPTGNNTVPLAEPGPTVVYYEVIFADYVAVESATVPVTLNPSPSGNAQPGVTAQGTVSFAPGYGPYQTEVPNPNIAQSLPAGFPDGATGGMSIPRFVTTSIPTQINLWSFTACPTVPNVVGSTQAAATSSIQSATLVVGTVTTAASATVASGSVISEIPAANTQVNAGSAVNLVVSSGPVQFQLTTAVSPLAAGTVTGAGLYNANAVATVVATPAAGYTFVNWTGPVASVSSASTTVAMTGAASITANFAAIPTTSTTTVAAATGTYGGAVTLSAAVGPVGSAVTGSLQFRIAGVNFGPAISVSGAGTYTANGAITRAAGTYAITAVLTATGAIAGSSGSNMLTVNTEGAIITPSPANPALVQANSKEIIPQPFTLQATLKNVDAGNKGNLSLANVTVTLVPGAGVKAFGPISYPCYVNNSGGALTAICPALPTNSYEVLWKITGNYYAGPEADSAIMIVEPSEPRPRDPRIRF